VIGLQWRPGKPERKPQPDPVVISNGPATPAVERAASPYDPFAAFVTGPLVSPKRKPGRPKKDK
jgi:hypothetical protein